MRVEVTDETVDKFFDGVLIPLEDFGTKYRVPGWRCRACGWTIGTQDLPYPHECPEALPKHEPGCQEIWNREIRRADHYYKALEETRDELCLGMAEGADVASMVKSSVEIIDKALRGEGGTGE